MSDKSATNAANLVAKVSSNISGPCVECQLNLDGIDNWMGSVNHYLAAHNFELLHVGQETSRDDDGGLWQSTVAILGRKP
ncbi:hypothetical protein [Pseudomonas vranovensis]|uniref:hypothetical protein n=1 Tax=Pseudomonas vranovensis TaxID=321661 RepID=UPI0011CE09AF|nr:hypothetical protein [Pseudomonas vranovensis]